MLFKKHKIQTNPYFYTLPSIEDIEIDTHSDLNLAKIVAKGLEK